MKIHRFIGDFSLIAGRQTLADRDVVHQLGTVLKLRAGEHIILGNGRGQESLATIAALNRKEIIVDLDVPRSVTTEAAHAVTLYCALLKRDNFEFVCQKATEVGVTAIVPLQTERTIKQNLKLDRLQAIIKEAAEQSGRGIVPTIVEPMSLADALRHAADHHILFCDVSGSTPITATSSAAVFIGPEGGWTPAEVAAAAAANAQIVTLGATTLRGETAAIVASYLACHS